VRPGTIRRTLVCAAQRRRVHRQQSDPRHPPTSGSATSWFAVRLHLLSLHFINNCNSSASTLFRLPGLITDGQNSSCSQHVDMVYATPAISALGVCASGRHKYDLPPTNSRRRYRRTCITDGELRCTKDATRIRGGDTPFDGFRTRSFPSPRQTTEQRRLRPKSSLLMT